VANEHLLQANLFRNAVRHPFPKMSINFPPKSHSGLNILSSVLCFRQGTTLQKGLERKTSPR